MPCRSGSPHDVFVAGAFAGAGAVAGRDWPASGTVVRPTAITADRAPTETSDRYLIHPPGFATGNCAVAAPAKGALEQRTCQAIVGGNCERHDASHLRVVVRFVAISGWREIPERRTHRAAWAAARSSVPRAGARA